MKNELNFFPHDSIRPIQKDMIDCIRKNLELKRDAVIHAPTGIGKTAATLAPALEYAKRNSKTVFFLTSRHTQHKIAIDTLRKIKTKTDADIKVADIIGKKWLCPHPGIQNLSSGDFVEFCKTQKEKDQCDFFLSTKDKNKLTTEAKLVFEKITQGILGAEEIIELCKEYKVCPYEIITYAASKADVIIADYYYIFNPAIQENFFARSSKKIEDCIIIVDEAHNLPGRIRELMTTRLSSFIISRAKKEIDKYDFENLEEYIFTIEKILAKLTEGTDREKLIQAADFTRDIEEQHDYNSVITALDFAADEVRDKQRSSFLGSIASFLDAWEEEEEGYIRIIEQYHKGNEKNITLSRKCLDPSLLTRSVIDSAHSTILMSGTLTPTTMYKDILGFPKETEEISLESPFPKNNRLSLVVPKTTTKYSMRNEAQYQEIAKICSEAANAVPGNVAIFFPSYFIMKAVNQYLLTKIDKTTFVEEPNMTQQDKNELLDRFKGYKKTGAVLLGVAAANFAEGVDLPGDLLKGVIIVGLPLQPPNLEIKELIKYYEMRFGNGWDYGYVLPAITKSMQAAGRCIRTENDKGIIMFLDQRYTFPNYFKCFPADWDIKISLKYEDEISKFFENNDQ